MVGVIGAMKIEVEKIKGLMENKSEKEIAGTAFVKGTLNGKELVVAVCGIGKVAAAFCAQAMIMEYHPDCIINTGVGGSLSPEVGICDTVIAETLVEHDMDTTPLGDDYGLISGINIVDIPTDKNVSDLLYKCACDIGKSRVFKGKIASGDQFVHRKEQKDFIVYHFNASVCEMEGAAIAHTCYCNKMPVGVVRAISDNADGSSDMDYMQFLPAAAENAAMIIEKFVTEY